MADRHLKPGTPQPRARWLRTVVACAIALPLIALMIGFAKAAQFASVDVFGDWLGFELASLVGAGPVIALYYFVAVRFPALNKFGLSRG